MPGRSSVDYREYREKKERERLEREKANAAGSSTGQNVSDPNKHHSHHHKQQIPGSVMPNKQAPTPNQKSALHHNHHHRPDMKMNQMSQRHTSTSQTRDPSRDPNRQRVPRDFNSGTSSTSGSMYTHHNISQNDSNLIAAQPDIAARLESGLPQESASHSNPQDKLSNNNHNVHRVSSHDKRYDPRHNKLPEHRKEDQKAYPEYRDMSRVDRQRKTDSLEQRSEEVRKLIEKPLPPPKSRQEMSKDDYITHILKQSHHSKHNQSDKLQGNSGQNLSIPITPQVQQKSLPKPMPPHQHSIQGMQQFIKESIKNGSSQSSSSISNVEDPKAEKRPRHEDKVMLEQQNAAPIKPKSLFSPEKVQRDVSFILLFIVGRSLMFPSIY